MLVYIGIVVILLPFILFLIPDSHRHLEKLLFSVPYASDPG